MMAHHKEMNLLKTKHKTDVEKETSDILNGNRNLASPEVNVNGMSNEVKGISVINWNKVPNQVKQPILNKPDDSSRALEFNLIAKAHQISRSLGGVVAKEGHSSWSEVLFSKRGHETVKMLTERLMTHVKYNFLKVIDEPQFVPYSEISEIFPKGELHGTATDSLTKIKVACQKYNSDTIDKASTRSDGIDNKSDDEDESKTKVALYQWHGEVTSIITGITEKDWNKITGSEYQIMSACWNSSEDKLVYLAYSRYHHIVQDIPVIQQIVGEMTGVTQLLTGVLGDPTFPCIPPMRLEEMYLNRPTNALTYALGLGKLPDGLFYEAKDHKDRDLFAQMIWLHERY